jgi:hypothetical protein
MAREASIFWGPVWPHPRYPHRDSPDPMSIGRFDACLARDIQGIPPRIYDAGDGPLSRHACTYVRIQLRRLRARSSNARPRPSRSTTTPVCFACKQTYRTIPRLFGCCFFLFVLGTTIH